MTTTETPWSGLRHIRKIHAINHPERGVVLSALIDDHTTVLNTQLRANGTTWSGWSNPARTDIHKIAGAQHSLGLSQLWALSLSGKLMGRIPERGGDWEEAGGPAFMALATVPEIVYVDPKNPRSARSQLIASKQQLWGITRDRQLIWARVAGRPLDPDLPAWNDAPPVFAVAATVKNDGLGQVWVLNMQQQLRSSAKNAPDSELPHDWSPWSKENWNGAPQLRAIAASQHRGAIASRDAAQEGVAPDHILLGITQKYELVASTLRSPNPVWGAWSPPNWNNCTGAVLDAAAVQQSDGCLQVWAVTYGGYLAMCRQTKRGGDWTAWQTGDFGWSRANEPVFVH